MAQSLPIVSLITLHSVVCLEFWSKFGRRPRALMFVRKVPESLESSGL